MREITGYPLRYTQFKRYSSFWELAEQKSMHTSKACIKPRNRSGLSKLADHTGFRKSRLTNG